MRPGRTGTRGRGRSASSEGGGKGDDAMPEGAADRPPWPVVSRDKDNNAVITSPPYSRAHAWRPERV